MSCDEILQACRVIKEMLKDRKVIKADDFIFDDIVLSENNYRDKIIINLDNVRLMFYMCDKNKINDIKNMFDQDLIYQTYILICKNNLMKKNVLDFTNVIENNIRSFQFFNIKELQYNISKHYLVPKHEIVNDDSVKNIMDNYNLKSINQLPIIFKNDPMAKYLNVKQGQVVKITRKNNFCGESINWRVCQNN